MTWRDIAFRHDRDTKYALTGRHAHDQVRQLPHRARLPRQARRRLLRLPPEGRQAPRPARPAVRAVPRRRRLEEDGPLRSQQVALSAARAPRAGRMQVLPRDARLQGREARMHRLPREGRQAQGHARHRLRGVPQRARLEDLGLRPRAAHPYPLDGAHAKVACVACHTAPARRSRRSRPPASPAMPRRHPRRRLRRPVRALPHGAFVQGHQGLRLAHIATSRSRCRTARDGNAAMTTFPTCARRVPCDSPLRDWRRIRQRRGADCRAGVGQTPSAQAVVAPSPAPRTASPTLPGPDAVAEHWTTGFPLTGAHERTRCESCHVRGEFKNTPKTCTGCHTAARPHQHGRDHVVAPAGHAGVLGLPQHAVLRQRAIRPFGHRSGDVRDLPQRHERDGQAVRPPRHFRIVRYLPQHVHLGDRADSTTRA